MGGERPCQDVPIHRYSILTNEMDVAAEHIRHQTVRFYAELWRSIDNDNNFDYSDSYPYLFRPHIAKTLHSCKNRIVADAPDRLSCAHLNARRKPSRVTTTSPEFLLENMF